MSRHFSAREAVSCRWLSANKRPLLLVLGTVCVVVLLSHALFVQAPQADASSTSTRVAFTSLSLAGSAMPEVKPAFPLFQQADTFVPAWVITAWNTSSVHRFFDSSPFSPSGRFVGVTRLHSEGTRISHKSTADIVVIDLKQGTEKVVASTHAFDSQVGAHVQWGRSDEELYFNEVFRDANGENPLVKGVRLNMFTGERKYVDCGIYALSPDGKFAATPSLPLIPYTQLGYGVRLEEEYIHPHTTASKDDGLFVVDLTTGQCRLVASMKHIARKTGLGVDFPTYGFHTKWNSAGNRIMFVIRQFRQKQGVAAWLGFGAETRRNHIVTMDPDGSNMKLAVAWGSEGGKIRNGNHPNWMPDGKRISMNLAFIGDIKSGRIRDMNAASSWSIVSFDEDGSNEKRLHPAGSGHPVGLPHNNQRYLVTDVYGKEQKYFNGLKEGESPLRLIDTRLKQEVHLLKVNVVPNHSIWKKKHPNTKFPLENVKEKGPWRCDMHPAFDNKFKWVAINARPDGGFRQVMIAYLGDHPGKFFAQDDD